MLGHDGARPYLSPAADHRRGWTHEIPESAKRASSPRGRGGRPERRCSLQLALFVELRLRCRSNLLLESL